MSRILWPITISALLYLLTDRLLDRLNQPSFNEQYYKLVYTVPPSHLTATKDAIFANGAGLYGSGKYKNCAFEVLGTGQFIPVGEAGANPHTGTVGMLERVQEFRVEIRCNGRERVKQAVEALKSSHPYETVGYEVYKVEDL